MKTLLGILLLVLSLLVEMFAVLGLYQTRAGALISMFAIFGFILSINLLSSTPNTTNDK